MMIEVRAYLDTELSHTAFRVLAYLAFLGGEVKETQEALAGRLGMAHRTFTRAVEELVERHYLAIERSGGRRPNVIRVSHATTSPASEKRDGATTASIADLNARIEALERMMKATASKADNDQSQATTRPVMNDQSQKGMMSVGVDSIANVVTHDLPESEQSTATPSPVTNDLSQSSIVAVSADVNANVVTHDLPENDTSTATTPSIGEQLKAWREGRGLSQRQAGEVLGIARATFGDYESGRRNPSQEVRERLLAVMASPD